MIQIKLALALVVSFVFYVFFTEGLWVLGRITRFLFLLIAGVLSAVTP